MKGTGEILKEMSSAVCSDIGDIKHAIEMECWLHAAGGKYVKRVGSMNYF